MKAIRLVLCLGLMACEDEPAAPAPKSKPKEHESPTRVEATSQPVDNYTYTPIGKRDPFRPYFIDQELQEADKNEGRSLSDLELLELDQLKLVGVVSGTSTPTAMFEDPEGRGHVVRIGTAIGKHGGKVNKIKKDEVVIMEEYRDPVTHKRIQSPVAVRLPSEEMTLE